LRGSVGLAAAVAAGGLDLRAAGAGTGPATTTSTTSPAAPPPPPPVPPASWPPKPEAFPGLTSDWVVQENALPGITSWQTFDPLEAAGQNASLRHGPPPQGIEGYLDTTSAALGDRVAFHVSTTAATYRIDAYRMGWYGGAGGRRVWQSAALPGWQQGPARYEQATRTTEALWDTSYEVTLDAPTFLPGCYLFRLIADNGASRYVPVTVRDEHSRARFLVVNAVSDWQAYNEWGGTSLYYGRRPGGRSRDYGNRARVVSFERPYDFGGGAGDFIGAELPLVMRLEEAGLDVAYVTSHDVHRDPTLLQRHAVVMSTAHDEYWTREMRQAFETARDHGVNLVFFGANACFRQVRFEDTLHGSMRREVCYKSASEDPMRSQHVELTTVNWRDSPVKEPEASMIGVQYDGQVRTNLVVSHPNAWIWESTGVGGGQIFTGVIGPEFDHIASESPANIEILSRSPVDVEIGGKRKSHADMTYYTAPSGGGVFATGTIGWISHLSPKNGAGEPVEPVLYHATMNVLRLFGSGPAGHTRPSVPNGR